jgi:hypothetical protein
MFSNLADTFGTGQAVLVPQEAELTSPFEMFYELVDVKMQEIINFLRLGKPGSYSPADLAYINEPLSALEKEFKSLNIPLFEVNMDALNEPGALDDIFSGLDMPGISFSFTVAEPIRDIIQPPAPISIDKFCTLYSLFRETQNRMSQNSLHNWSTVRPNPPADRGLVTPSQVRFWKRWSKVLQGSTSFPKVDPRA